MNRRLKAELTKLGIHECEIQIKGRCVRSIMLSFAHSKKSRFLITDQDWLEAALCCIPCHDVIEALPHDQMKEAVLAAISRRPALTTTPIPCTSSD